MGDRVAIFTDGASRGNPGPGGWGAVLMFRGKKKELFGGENPTTNNRMEITAAIQALKSLKRPCQVDLYTDSQYLRKGVTEWIENWKRRGWKTGSGKSVKNIDLWVSLDKIIHRHEIKWHWVKAHAGIRGNEAADSLANKGIDELNI